MFEEIVTEEEIKFNNLEKKIFKFVCNFGCLIIKLILESYDRKIMKARDTKKYRHKGLRKNTIKTVMGEVEYVRAMYEVEEAGNTNEDVMLMLDDMPSTTYYRNRKKAIRLYATMLWAFTRPEKIQNKMEEINWKKSGSKVAVN